MAAHDAQQERPLCVLGKHTNLCASACPICKRQQQRRLQQRQPKACKRMPPGQLGCQASLRVCPCAHGHRVKTATHPKVVNPSARENKDKRHRQCSSAHGTTCKASGSLPASGSAVNNLWCYGMCQQQLQGSLEPCRSLSIGGWIMHAVS